MRIHHWAGEIPECPYKHGDKLPDEKLHEVVDTILAAKLNVMVVAGRWPLFKDRKNPKHYEKSTELTVFVDTTIFSTR